MAGSCERRKFLQAAAGAVLVPAVAPARLQIVSNPVNVAFLGNGPDVPELRAACTQVPGFRIAGTGGLSDPAIDAVCIAATQPLRARLTVAACAAHRDVYLAGPLCEPVEEIEAMAAAARRYGRVVQTGSAQRSGAAYRSARRIVQSGELGDVAFCRIGDPDWMDLVHFVFDDESPLSASVQHRPNGTLATYRYSRVVVSCEPGPAGASFHGSLATLLVDRDGCRVFREDGTQRIIQAAADNALVDHWRDWLRCIRTRRAPAAEIGKSVALARARAMADPAQFKK
jgi:predicted dehydrogenase